MPFSKQRLHKALATALHRRSKGNLFIASKSIIHQHLTDDVRPQRKNRIDNILIPEQTNELSSPVAQTGNKTPSGGMSEFAGW